MATTDFSTSRKAMVDGQLRTNAITDARVVQAFEDVPRENFVPEHYRSVAFTDRPVPLVEGRFLNPPLTTARMVNELQLHASDHVLIIGAATGYTAAIVARLAGQVVAVEDNVTMAKHLSTVFANVPNVQCVSTSLSEGAPQLGPYSVILIDGAVDKIPSGLTDQLADRGRLAACIVDEGVTRLVLGKKFDNHFGTFPIIEMEASILPGFSKPKAFTF